MNRNPIIIIVCVSLLITLLIAGFPVEIKNQFSERIARIITSILIGIIFFILIRLSKKISTRKTRLPIRVGISIVLIPYIFICVYNVSTAMSKNYETWKDISIVENENGDKISYQFRETSGSIYDYRYRIIYFENEFIRISRNSNIGKKTGWSTNI